MRPESLLGIALELIDGLAAPGSLPADARVGRLFREKRFLGSHDRRFVGDAAYAWLRHFHRARPRWTTLVAEPGLEALAAIQSADGRKARLADVLTIARDGLFPWMLDATLAAALRLELEPLSPEIARAWADERWGADGAWPRDPMDRLAAEVSLPRWLAERLAAERGEEEARRLALSLLEPAPVDLRVNLRRIERDIAREQIERQIGSSVSLTPWSPLGLRISGRKALGGTDASREGWIEVEDEGSQIMVLCLEPSPGSTVIDACAGAGGKTLAFADLLFRNSVTSDAGRIIACDIAESRLVELLRRARLAGVDERITTVSVSADGPPPADLPPADLVLIDAPCSGLGTLRRSPDLKHRYGPADVAAFARVQRAILERFLPLVKDGGRIAYATCSILAEENEDVARDFGAAHPDLEEETPAWARERLPAACLDGPRVRIDPARIGTDAFFLSLWRKQ